MQYEEFIALRDFSKNKISKNTWALKLGHYYYCRGDRRSTIGCFDYEPHEKRYEDRCH